MRKTLIIAAAATISVLTPIAASAQQSSTTDTATSAPVGTERHDFPWGLLGLIGLAGLIPRKHTIAPLDRTTSRT